MTAQPTPSQRPRWFLPLIMLIAGLIIGYVIGMTTTKMALTKAGDCVRGDSTVVATGVSQQSCRETCPTCMWVQNR